MKLTLLNTPQGLKPCYDADYEEKKRLKLGEYYQAEIKLQRNPEFHRKYFALVNAAYELLPGRIAEGFRTVENFRKYLEVAAGHCDTFFSPKVGGWVEIPATISFDKMDQAEFEDLYKRVRDVIDTILQPYISDVDFERVLLNF